MDAKGKKGAIQLGSKNWTVEGVGDFDADGNADVLWEIGNDDYRI